MPLHWRGFKQTVRYTYVIEHTDGEDIEKNFENDIRRRIKNATENGVQVNETYDIEAFYEINKMTFERKNMPIPYDFEFVKMLYEKCKQHNAAKIYIAEFEGKAIAGNFIVYDTQTAYYLMGGINPDYANLGGMDMVLSKSINFALNEGLFLILREV